MEYVKDTGAKKIYITNWTQSENSWWVSEPLTLFHHQVDAKYYQGKVDLYTQSGEKLPSYKNRYNYVRISELEIDPE